MSRKHADTLTDERLNELLGQVLLTNPQPKVMTVAFMLSFYAGMRVQEIAGLDWRLNVFNADGEFKVTNFPAYDGVGNAIKDSNGKLVMRPVESVFIGSNIGKYGNERSVPINPYLKGALRTLFDEQRGELGFPADPYVIPSAKDWASQDLRRRAHALKMRITRVYKELGLSGCSSHSGRRSFVTRAATKASAMGLSLRDVQVLAGHKNLVTTQAYIDISDKHADLVNVLWD